MKGPAKKSGLLHAGFAFTAMGMWAMFANREHGWQAMLTGGAVQGAVSACITLCLKRFIETIVSFFSGWVSRILPAAACFLFSLILLCTIHFLMGTPELLATIAIPLFVSTSYSATYSQLLFRESHLANWSSTS